jgi:aminoglycoside phosphotransferase (APT) family kinase protein
MSTASVEELTTTGLARYFTELWSRPVGVTLDGIASAGARRRNVLFTADDGERQHRLVATIVPTAAMQIQDFMIEPTVIQVAEAHGVPVPHLVGATTDESYVGGPFFVTERVDGESVPRRVLRVVESLGLGETVAEQCGRAIAALHQVPLDELPAGVPRPVNDSPIEQALANFEESNAGLLQPSPVFSLALRWLETHAPPAPATLTVVHGDFRNGNMIVGEDGLRAMLDWEIVRVGDPMEDAAWICVRMWRFGNNDLEVGGFAGKEVFARAYVDAGGTWDEERFAWWRILGTLRWGAGLAGQAMAHLDGSVPSIVMAASGRRIAEQEYDVLSLLQPLLLP